MSLTLLHTRYLALETLRVPIAVIGTAMFPLLSMLFLVVPFSAVSGDPVAATAATAQLCLFAVFSVCVFHSVSGSPRTEPPPGSRTSGPCRSVLAPGW